MEVALIPPVVRLDDTKLTRYQLMLPQLMNNQDYYKTYIQLCQDPSKTVIMDNGAAESVAISDDALFHNAMEFLPHEIACPDVLGNRDETVARSTAFIKKYGPALADAQILRGYVCQGFDAEDAFNGLNQFLRETSYEAGYVDVLYIPRLLVRPHNQTARLQLAQMIFDEYEERFDIHFFGASQYWAREVIHASSRDYIRSIDTSLPYNFSHANMSMESRAQIGRPDGYFNRPIKDFPNADIFVRKYLSWAR